MDRQGLVKEIVVSGIDVTKRIAAEKALLESELLFRQFVENIEEVFWVSDATKDQIIYVSPSFEKVWGYTAEQLYANGQKWLEAVHPEDHQRVFDLYYSNSKNHTDDDYS